jgi:hypothetical protein
MTVERTRNRESSRGSRSTQSAVGGWEKKKRFLPAFIAKMAHGREQEENETTDRIL